MNAFRGNQRRVISYLNEHAVRPVKKSEIKSEIYFDSKLGIDYDNDISTLLSVGLIQVNEDESEMWIPESAIDKISVSFLAESDFIFDDILIDFDYALIRYLKKRNEEVKFKEFPAIFYNLNPDTSDTRTEIGKLEFALFKLRRFINNFGDWYILNDYGEQYCQYLESEQEKLEKKKTLESDQIQSVIDTNASVRKTNTIQMISIICTIAIIATALFIQWLSYTKDKNEKRSIDESVQSESRKIHLQATKSVAPVSKKDSVVNK